MQKSVKHVNVYSVYSFPTGINWLGWLASCVLYEAIQNFAFRLNKFFMIKVFNQNYVRCK